jgi:hypothetical protein
MQETFARGEPLNRSVFDCSLYVGSARDLGCRLRAQPPDQEHADLRVRALHLASEAHGVGIDPARLHRSFFSLLQ